jgi:hypothetical protein
LKPLSVHVLLAASLGASLIATAQAEPRKPLAIRAEPAPASRPLETAAVAPDVRTVAPPDAPIKSLLVDSALGDVGYANGFRLSNLGGRREVYIPIPQGVELSLAEFVLVLDDVSAHDSRRSLEVLVNDRSISAIPLDGKSNGRIVRIPLANVTPREGFLKLSFLYSGAATQDRCIDVRYVGDSVTVRPESAIQFEIGIAGAPNITATAAMMPQNVAILLSSPQPSPADIATALTLARSLNANGRRVTFHHGVDALPELVKREDRRKWTRGLVVVGAFDRIAGSLDAPAATLVSAAGPVPVDNTLSAARIGGAPVLLVTDAASARAGRLLGNPSLAALRDTQSGSVGRVTQPRGPADRVSFDELGLVPAQAEVSAVPISRW